MEELKEKTAGLADHVEDLANTFYRLTVIKATEKASNMISGAVVAILICLTGFMVLLFMGVALGWWLGTLINSRAGGFLLAAAFFLIVLLFLSFLGKKTIFPFIRDLIIRKMYD